MRARINVAAVVFVFLFIAAFAFGVTAHHASACACPKCNCNPCNAGGAVGGWGLADGQNCNPVTCDTPDTQICDCGTWCFF